MEVRQNRHDHDAALRMVVNTVTATTMTSPTNTRMASDLRDRRRTGERCAHARAQSTDRTIVTCQIRKWTRGARGR